LDASIIDCGGGVVENVKNIEILMTKSVVIWVDASIDIIYQRLSRKTDRPFLVSNDLLKDIKTTYFKRRPLYQKYCDIIVDNSKGEAENISKKILKMLF
jgi:shikimate kinase